MQNAKLTLRTAICAVHFYCVMSELDVPSDADELVVDGSEFGAVFYVLE